MEALLDVGERSMNSPLLMTLSVCSPSQTDHTRGGQSSEIVMWRRTCTSLDEYAFTWKLMVRAKDGEEFATVNNLPNLLLQRQAFITQAFLHGGGAAGRCALLAPSRVISRQRLWPTSLCHYLTCVLSGSH